MQNALTQMESIDRELVEHDIQVLPPRCYFKYREPGGVKVYIPILHARGYRARLSRKIFRRAQAANQHATRFHKRFIRMKEASEK